MTVVTNQQVNLYRPALSRRHNLLSRGKIALVVSAVFMAAVAVLSQSGYSLWMTQRQIDQIKNEIATAEALLKARQLEALQNADGVDVAALEQAVAQTKADAAALEAQMGGSQVSYAGILVALAQNIVPGVRLTTVEFGSGLQQTRIVGAALEPIRVTQYLARLRTDAALDGLELQGLKIGAPAAPSHGSVEFVVTTEAVED